MNRGSEHLNYEDCEALYRAAKSEERPSTADRHAVRLAVMASVAATVQLAAAGSASAALSTATSGATAPHILTAQAAGTVASAGTGTAVGTGAGAAAGTGLAAGSATSSLLGAKGLLQLLAGGKFLTGLLVGAVVGTVGSAAAFVAIPPTGTAAKATPPLTAPARGQRPGTPMAPRETLASSRPEQPSNVRGSIESGSTVEAAPRALIGMPPVEAVARVSANPAVLPVTTKAPMPPSPNAAPSDRLLEETRALATVQEALSRNAPDEAFALLRDQERRYPAGQLVQERAAARVLAMCAAGNEAEASKARAQFLGTYPDSPLADRVLKGCSP